MSPPLRPIDRDGVGPAARVIARSFADDPGWAHVFPDAATRAARTERVFALLIRRVYVGLGESWALAPEEGAVVGAAIWTPPGRDEVPALTALRLAPRLAWIIGRRTPRALRLFRAMERGRPSEPCFHLIALGVDPQHQGRGYGGRLLAPVLERCDAERTTAWLETTNPKNHSFYRRMGFELAGEEHPREGPPIAFFGRRPR